MIRLTSYGCKWATHPPDLTLKPFDCRFLKNPHRNPALRYLRGTDVEVAREVLGTPGAMEFVIRIQEFARPGDHVGIYCTAGRHRSVAIAEAVAHGLRARGETVTLTHRDIGRTK